MLKMLMDFFKGLFFIIQLSSFNYSYRIASRGESLFIWANLGRIYREFIGIQKNGE